MTELDRFKQERDALLIEHLDRLNIYELERLKSCFESEYRWDVDNRDSLDNILYHLNQILINRGSNMSALNV